MADKDRDIQGMGLSLLNRLAGSRTIEKLGLRKPTEQVIYQASRTSFRMADVAGRPFKSASKLLQPSRLGRGRKSELFDLNPTDEQQMLIDSLGRFAADVLRAEAEDAEVHAELSEECWKGAFELGLSMLAVPESLGGAGDERSPVTWALTAEALAHGDMGQALALMAPIGVANALAQWGNADQQGRYLPAFCEATPPDAAIVMLEPDALADVSRPGCRGERQDDRSWRITGEKSLVPLAPYADLLLISVDLEGLGPRLVLVEKFREGLSVRNEPAMGLRSASLGRIYLQGVAVDDRDVVGDAETLSQAIALSRLGWCALAVGCAQAAVDYVIPYVNERKAFGEPVSHRQGVAFTVANMASEVAAMRLLVWRAVARAEQQQPFQREAALAHRYCAEQAMQVGSDAVQMLGGHGFVKEHPVERWYRDLRAVGMMDGGLML